MRYAVISDIHSNLESLGAVLDDIAKEGADEYLCVGDVVGYGADPKESIRLVGSLRCKAVIAGNHEWGALGLLDLDYFNEYAREAVIWTKDTLDKRELEYLKSFQLVYKSRSFTLVHGSLVSPERFNYIFDAADAYDTMRLSKTQVCFVGHSHAAGIFYSQGDRMERAREPEMNIEEGKKYVVNVGSVGQPRDRDPRASYAIYDDSEKTVEIRRVAYDIKTAQEKILKAGLPEFLACRLSEGR